MYSQMNSTQKQCYWLRYETHARCQKVQDRHSNHQAVSNTKHWQTRLIWDMLDLLSDPNTFDNTEAIKMSYITEFNVDFSFPEPNVAEVIAKIEYDIRCEKVVVPSNTCYLDDLQYEDCYETGSNSYAISDFTEALIEGICR